MENALWYFAGLLTIPALALLALLREWLIDKNLEMDCFRCRRRFGWMGKTYARITVLKFWWHRRNGECKQNTK